MAAVLLLILLSSQIYLSDASKPAATHQQPLQQNSKYPLPTSPWSSRRSLQQQIPIAPPQTIAFVPRQSSNPPSPADQQPPPPPEPPKTAGNSTADTASPGTAAPPSPDQGFNQRRTLQLPPHVYLISFVMLLAIMGGLLTCHCLRMCRIARRMRHAAELGVTISSAGSMLSKRTPQSVIESLPVAKYSSIQSQRQAKSATSGDKGTTAAPGTNRMNPFVAAAMQLREQLARQSGISSRSFSSSSAAVQAAGAGADAAVAAAGCSEAPQQLRHSSSTNSLPGWRRSFSIGRKSAAAGEITADSDVSSQITAAAAAAPAAAADGNSSAVSSPDEPPLAAALDASRAGAAAGCSSSSGAEPCAICFEDFSADDDVKQLPCHHYFHVSCIDEWLVRDTTCPLCKGTVLDEDLIEQQQRISAQLEASLGGLGGGAMARRRQQQRQQQQAGGRRSRRSIRSRQTASNPSSSSDESEQHQDEQQAANSSDSGAAPAATVSAPAQQSGESAAAASSAAGGGDIELGLASRSSN